MICRDGGEGKEKVRSSGGRLFKSRGAVTDTALLENMRWEVTGVKNGRDRMMIG